jgi:ribosomal-protein-alanine N-acetyltransferase
VRSTRALEGVGFKREGVLRQYHRHEDRFLDVNEFGMLRAEWEAGALAEVEMAVEGAPPPAFLTPGAGPS